MVKSKTTKYCQQRIVNNAWGGPLPFLSARLTARPGSEALVAVPKMPLLTTATSASPPCNTQSGGHSLDALRAQIQDQIEPIKSTSGVDVTEKVKELISLARDQGYLTYDDIDDVWPTPASPKGLDEIHARLGNLE